MKSLLLSLLLLPLIAVIAVNGLYFPEIDNDHLELELRNSVNTTTAESSGDCESNGGECKKNKKQCKGEINRENTCSKNGVCCIVEVRAQDEKVLTNDVTILTLYNLIKELEEKVTRQGCPEGFFQLNPSGQCLKFFNDQKRTWFEAAAKCQTEGLVSARPSDPETLQKYLVNTYGIDPSKGDPSVWIPARGSGSSYFIWQPTGAWNSSGPRIHYNSPYFESAPSSSYISKNTCIYMPNYDAWMKVYPGKPYTVDTCTCRYRYTLCELVKE